MPRRLDLVVLVAAVLSAAPAGAQTSSSEGIRGRLFVHFEGQAMTAKDSFDAVAGTSTLMGMGVGVEAQNVWRRLFVRGAISRFKKTGDLWKPLLAARGRTDLGTFLTPRAARRRT